MKISSNAGLAPDWENSQDPGLTQVRARETLASIASRLGVSLQDLQKANPQLGEAGQLAPGSDIRIPAGGRDDAAEPDQTPRPASAGSSYMEGNLEASLNKPKNRKPKTQNCDMLFY